MEVKKQVNYIFKNGIVITMDDKETILKNGAVAVSGNRIESIGKTSQIEAQYEAGDSIDASGKVLLPGLVNTHTHAAMTIFRGIADDMPLEPWLQTIWPLEKKYATAENVKLGSQLAFAEMITGGTTTAADMYWHCTASAEAAAEMGFRLVAGTGVLELFEGGSWEEQEAGMRSFIEQYLDHPLIRPCALAHAANTVSRSAFENVRDLANEYGIIFITHASESRQEVKAVVEKTGKTPIYFFDELKLLNPHTLLAHTIHLDDNEIELLAERGTSIAHCPESNLKIGNGIARVPELLAAGVNIGLGTDGAASNNDLDMWGEIRMAALIHKGTHNDPTVVPAYEVLKMATINGAKALNLDNTIGSLEPGKFADMIMLDLSGIHLTPMYNIISHLVYAVKACDVNMVMIHGRMVMRDRHLLTIDEKEIREKTHGLAQTMRSD
jgi:5-methylthioadenosine/S-adenosylhomocysteine deaminase